MGDVGDMFNEMRNERREKRRKYGMPCPTCTVNLPKAQPTILLPHQRCRVCGYVDKRARGEGK